MTYCQQFSSSALLWLSDISLPPSLCLISWHLCYAQHLLQSFQALGQDLRLPQCCQTSLEPADWFVIQSYKDVKDLGAFKHDVAYCGSCKQELAGKQCNKSAWRPPFTNGSSTSDHSDSSPLARNYARAKNRKCGISRMWLSPNSAPVYIFKNVQDI